MLVSIRTAWRTFVHPFNRQYMRSVCAANIHTCLLSVMPPAASRERAESIADDDEANFREALVARDGAVLRQSQQGDLKAVDIICRRSSTRLCTSINEIWGDQSLVFDL